MSDIARLCIMCAVSSVCVTLTVCAVIFVCTIIGNLWESLRKLTHWTFCQIRDEVNQDEKARKEESE